MNKLGVNRYDGGWIKVGSNRKEAIEWYCITLGLKVSWDLPEEKMTHLNFPTEGGITLKGLNDGESVLPEANVRFCFETLRLQDAYDAVKRSGTRVSEIYEGPGYVQSFDFYDLDNTRLTAVDTRQVIRDRFPDALFASDSIRIGVSDLQKSIQWYADYLGFEAIQQDATYALLKNEEGSVITLEKLPADAFNGIQDPAVRPFFVIESSNQFLAAHELLRNEGIEVSSIEGNVNTLAIYHLYDLDGNRINIWTFG
ncbi:VOC family protein [Paenibacillus sp. PR3]|uniref:VOC family protein n=1 Tax=Paenibacillus terricola TaxID=2763503 RepID=A0ABR8MTJ1_9BACL|nr:VOC family protein [Paenibacillus terricola]MBD3918396.1 VOC family protein [Paenibacillus terricola]